MVIKKEGQDTIQPVMASVIDEISFRIPVELVKEFEDDLRVVIRHPWTIGIPIPERLKPEIFKELRDFDIIVTPKQFQR